MNFKFRRFFSLAINFILGAFFCLVGILGMLLPWFSSLQTAIVNLILNHTLILSLFGLSGFFIGLSMVIYAIFNTSRRYAHIKIGSKAILIDESLVEQYLQAYWKKNFPSNQIPFYLTIKKNAIQIVADLPAVPETEQERFLEKIQTDFSDLFGRILGYSNEIHFIAHFQNEPQSPHPIQFPPQSKI